MLLTFSIAFGSVTFSTYDQGETLGIIKVVCDKAGHNPLLYMEVDATKFQNLAAVMNGLDIDIPVPPECPPFKNAFLSFPVGQVHPPFDGRQFSGGRPGGYGMPHVDVHFLVVTGEERISLTQGCAVVEQGPSDSLGNKIQCDYSVMNDGMKKFVNAPPPEYTTGFVEAVTFGGHAIVGHGLHMIPKIDMIGTGHGPGLCMSTGPTESWVDCMTQFMSFVNGGAFVEQNCTCGYWHDMTSAILNVFDGKVLGNEVMPALGIVDLLKSGALPNPYMEDYPTAMKYDSTGHQAVATLNEFVASSNVFRAGLVLSDKHTTADSAMTCGDVKQAYKSNNCCGNPGKAFAFP